MWEVYFNMSETLFRKTNKARATASFHISGYEKKVLLKRLEKAVEKLKEARQDIHMAIQLILRMKEAGDDMAEPAIAAVAEMYPWQGNPWVLSSGAKAKMKREAAKPLLLLRSD
jgi:hypothetical protein